MRKSIALKWVKALRSGQYKQTTKVLKDDVGFCCLGVLCDISKLSSFVVNEDSDSSRYIGENEVLSNKVLAWSGIKARDGMFFVEQKMINLAELNDGGSSFDEIATIIEQNWEKI